MKKKLAVAVCAVMMTAALFAGCGSANSTEDVTESTSVETTAESSSEDTTEESSVEDTSETESTSEEEADASEEETDSTGAELEDGVYTAEFNTDSTMFHVNEALDGKGTLTVENGEMTIHVSLVSKNIVNLFPGTKEEAQEEGAELLQPTTDTIEYTDGTSDEVYGFDIPVPALDEEFDIALIGTKGTWYDHKVSVTNPVAEEA